MEGPGAEASGTKIPRAATDRPDRIKSTGSGKTKHPPHPPCSRPTGRHGSRKRTPPRGPRSSCLWTGRRRFPKAKAVRRRPLPVALLQHRQTALHRPRSTAQHPWPRRQAKPMPLYQQAPKLQTHQMHCRGKPQPLLWRLREPRRVLKPEWPIQMLPLRVAPPLGLHCYRPQVPKLPVPQAPLLQARLRLCQPFGKPRVQMGEHWPRYKLLPRRLRNPWPYPGRRSRLTLDCRALTTPTRSVRATQRRFSCASPALRSA